MQRHRFTIFLAGTLLFSGCLDGHRVTGEAARSAEEVSRPAPAEPPRESIAPETASGPTSVKITCDATSVYVGQSTQCHAYYFPFENSFGYDVTSSAQFSSANPGVMSMSGSTATGVAPGSTYLRADYNGDMGIVSVSVTNPPAPAPLSVNGIRGPARVHPMDTCEWYVSFGGGVAPYTFQWGGLATGHTGGSVVFQPGSSGAFDVIVRDATGATGYGSFYVEVTSDQLPGCY